MKRIACLGIQLLVVSLFLCPVAHAEKWVPVKNEHLDYPVFISGTNLKGQSNITEPKPERTEYLQVIVGGVILIEEGAALFLKVQVAKEPLSRLYFKIEYPNPADPEKPLVNEMEYQPGGGTYIFSSPETIKGLAGYGDYVVKVSVYETKESEKPIEILNQKIRSYVDTRQDEVLIFKKVLRSL